MCVGFSFSYSLLTNNRVCVCVCVCVCEDGPCSSVNAVFCSSTGGASNG